MDGYFSSPDILGTLNFLYTWVMDIDNQKISFKIPLKKTPSRIRKAEKEEKMLKDNGHEHHFLPLPNMNF